jgi:ABC-2 type transport system permease protein/ribosome-dependent ATPase
VNFRRVAAVARKEWREVLRDRLFFSLAFAVPVIFMVLFGYGLTLDVENIPFSVLDYDRSSASRDYAHRFIGSRYFDFRGHARDEREIERLLKDNRIRAAIVIPEHFGRNLSAGRTAAVQILLDGTIPSRAQTAKGYVAAITAAANTDLLAEYLASQGGLSLAQARASIAPVGLEVRYLYNQAVRSIWSLAPKFVFLILLFVPPILTAVGVVREKETGSIYNIYASTVTRGEFLCGKLAPYVAISVANLIVLWAMAAWLYGAPFKGDAVFFFLASTVFVICVAAIGLLVSLLVRTQIAAIFLTAVLTMMPALDYSGFLVPIHSMDATGQVIARSLPFMYATQIIEGSFLKGLGFGELWPELLVLAAYTAALLAVGYFLFTKRPAA